MKRVSMRRARAGHEKKGTRAVRGRRVAAALVATVASAALAATAQASTLTVGSVLPLTFTSTEFAQVQTMFNTTLPEKGANLVSPVDGAIVRWRMQGAEGGPYYLRVLDPDGKGAYAASGKSGPATPVGSGLQTFSANIPVHAGDLIGVDPTNATDKIGVATVDGAAFGFIFPPPFDGATVAPSGGENGKEIELSAEVQPEPTITSISPASGSIKGGDTVVIKGQDLNGASAVSFGTTPAAGFTVESETAITATSPVTAKPGAVDVSVKTLAGTSEAVRADRFTYKACVVPKLKGKKLAEAKKALRRAECKLGKVKGPKKGVVTKQTPKVRKVLAPGSKVSVTLTPEKKKKKKKA